ncbi:flagellar protein FlaG [Pseudoalteromonas sp. G4]|uniref:flagellar protein FlaG n=1 Tax=Pseudoalteromonas sp. G4 TaxID=2992761 RepID=UPI00237DC507|nr:flagellar protein FlaG [Pseudoalteromonas sp. G4]MDE3271749.1 flagellar protein FlaG [Pseudoalteromonas sp. G4]
MNTIPETVSSVLDINSALKKQELSQSIGMNRANESENVSDTTSIKRNDSQKNDENFFDEIRENLKKINDFIPVSSTNLIFEFDELGEPPVVKVIDKSNDEVIREIPPQEIRDVAKAFESLADKLITQTGILFNDSV